MSSTRYIPSYTRALGGDVAASLMLSQIVYWYSPDRHGNSKLRVFKYGQWWLAKSHRDWEEELGITQKQTSRCLQVLRHHGLITTRVCKFSNQTVTHIHLVGIEGNATLESPQALF